VSRSDDAGIVVPDVSYDPPEKGVRARDRETEAELVVVDVFARTAAANHVVDGRKTVADANPDYDPAAPVAECVYSQALGVPAEEADLEALLATPDFADLRTYHFPIDRLDVLDGGQGGGR